jgi:hypothetical protein
LPVNCNWCLEDAPDVSKVCALVIHWWAEVACVRVRWSLMKSETTKTSSQ